MADRQVGKDGPQARKRAVALEYDPAKHPAPAVVATGAGPLADRIIGLANKHGIPVKEDPELVQLLAKLDVGNLIPPELYVAVAEVLVFVYQMNRKYIPPR